MVETKRVSSVPIDEKDQRWLDYCNEIKNPLVEAKRSVSENWDKYYKFYVGKHWVKDDPVHPRPVTNFCFSHTRTSVALMTDNKPIIAALPVDKSDIDKANIVARIIQNLWDKNHCQELLSKTLIDSHIFGTGFWKIAWDAVMDDVGIYVVPPEYIFVDPSATSIYDCKLMAQIMPLSMSVAKEIFDQAQYKGNLDRLKGTNEYSWNLDRQDVADNISSTGTTRFTDTTGSRTTEYNNGEVFKLGGTGRDKFAVFEEFYAWDDESKQFKIITMSEGYLIDIKNGGKYLPFVPIYNYWDSNRFWGMGDIQHIAPRNRAYNTIMAAIEDHIRLCGNTLFVMDSNAGIDIEYLTNLEALCVVKTPGAEFRRDQPVPLPPDFFRILADIKLEIDTLTGLFDVMQGRRPVGLTAGVAIAELQEAAQVPIRDKVRRVQSALTYAGKILLQEIKAHYKKKRILRIVKGTNPEFYDVNPADIADEYDILFDIESGFGQTRKGRIEQAMNLYNLKLLDPQGVHDSIGLPDREEILRRLAVSSGMNNLISSGLFSQAQSANQSDINGIMNQAGMQLPDVKQAG